MYKQITVKKVTWDRLWDLKRKQEKRSIDEVITELLNRDEQEVRI